MCTYMRTSAQARTITPTEAKATRGYGHEPACDQTTDVACFPTHEPLEQQVTHPGLVGMDFVLRRLVWCVGNSDVAAHVLWADVGAPTRETCRHAVADDASKLQADEPLPSKPESRTAAPPQLLASPDGTCRPCNRPQPSQGDAAIVGRPTSAFQ